MSRTLPWNAATKLLFFVLFVVTERLDRTTSASLEALTESLARALNPTLPQTCRLRRRPGHRALQLSFQRRTGGSMAPIRLSGRTPLTDVGVVQHVTLGAVLRVRRQLATWGVTWPPAEPTVTVTATADGLDVLIVADGAVLARFPYRP